MLCLSQRLSVSVEPRVLSSVCARARKCQPLMQHGNFRLPAKRKKKKEKKERVLIHTEGKKRVRSQRTISTHEGMRRIVIKKVFHPLFYPGVYSMYPGRWRRKSPDERPISSPFHGCLILRPWKDATRRSCYVMERGMREQQGFPHQIC